MEYPKARVEGLVITEAGDDLLIYDQVAHVLHTLNPAASDTWQLCDGMSTVADVVEGARLTEDTVVLALNQLSDARLIEDYTIPATEEWSSRRRFMQKTARSIAVATPLIMSVTAQSAMAANSGCIGTLLYLHEDCATRPNCCNEDDNLACLPYGDNEMICLKS